MGDSRVLECCYQVRHKHEKESPINSIHRFAHAFIEEFMKLSLPDTGLSLYLEQAEQLFRFYLLFFVSEHISECDELLCQQSALRKEADRYDLWRFMSLR